MISCVCTPKEAAHTRARGLLVDHPRPNEWCVAVMVLGVENNRDDFLWRGADGGSGAGSK